MAMEFGHSKIDFDFRKQYFKKKTVSAVPTEIPGFKIIEFEPRITWGKRPLPTMIPSDGIHGGIIYRKFRFKDNYGNSLENKFNNVEVYIPNVAFGSGDIVVSGSGPVLLGVGSFVPGIKIFLPWIVLLLLISAILWAIMHMKCKKSEKLFIKKSYKKKETIETWDRTVSVKNQNSDSRDVSVLNGSIQTIKIDQDFTKFLPVQVNAVTYNTPSLSNYSNCVRYSLIQSVKSNHLQAESSASIFNDQRSLTSTILGSGTYGILTQMQIKLRLNELVVHQESGIIFTVSEKNCPNSYFREDSEPLNLCQASRYTECLEVFLVCNKTILVGKMKNNNMHNTEPFVIQTWSTTNGTICENDNDFIECTCMCPIRDEYLVVISTEELALIHLPSYNCISRVESPFSVVRIHHNASTVQATKNMNHIVITELISQKLSIYVWDFEDLKQGAHYSKMKTYSNMASSFSLITSSQIIVALHSNEVFLWNFKEKSEDLVLRRSSQDIQRLVASPTGQLLLIQFATKLSVLDTEDWSVLFNIPVSSEQVCALTFSSEMDGSIYLGIALDNGSIRIYHSFSGQLIRTLSIDIPVTFLMFDDMKSLLYALSDRASHCRISIFSVT